MSSYWELPTKTTLTRGKFRHALSLENKKRRKPPERWPVRWATAELACVTAAETQRQREGKRLGRKLCWLLIGQLQDRGLPSENTTRWLGHLVAFEVPPCVCVCVTSGVVIQTHVNIIFSERSSLFYCKCGSRLEGGDQNQPGWGPLGSCWKQLTAARSR